MKINIAIDGPGAAGKSTIAKRLAKQLNYTHLDTGAMYRCCAYYAHINHVNIEDSQALDKMLDVIQISIKQEVVMLNGEDVSVAIRSNENSMRTSAIAKKVAVRDKMVQLQRAIAKDGGYILDGRDIGSVVLPDAQLKIYLVASAHSRAKRRYDEYLSKNIQADLDEITKDLLLRDEQDMTRTQSPLIRADDAIEIDTSNLSIEEVCTKVETLCKQLIRK